MLPKCVPFGNEVLDQIHCVVVAYASRCSRGHCHNPLLESESKELHPTRKAPPFV